MELILKIKEESARIKNFLKNTEGVSVRRTLNNSLIVSLLPDEDNRCVIPSIFSEERVLVNANECRTAEGVVMIVGDAHGNPLRPYWTRSKKSQSQQDGIDVRFSLSGRGTLVTLNKNGLLVISSIWVKKALSSDEKIILAELKLEEKMHPIVLKKIEGKFIFPGQAFKASHLKGFSSMVQAAIIKANKPNGGPVYFLEKEAAVIFHEEDGGTVVMTSRKGFPVFSGGVAIPDQSQASSGMTVRT